MDFSEKSCRFRRCKVAQWWKHNIGPANDSWLDVIPHSFRCRHALALRIQGRGAGASEPPSSVESRVSLQFRLLAAPTKIYKIFINNKTEKSGTEENSARYNIGKLLCMASPSKKIRVPRAKQQLRVKGTSLSLTLSPSFPRMKNKSATTERLLLKC